MNSWHKKSATLPQLCEAISNPTLDYKKDREKINELVLNLTLKYIAEYFDVPYDASLDAIGNKVSQENINAAQNGGFQEELKNMFGSLMGETIENLKSNDVGAKQSLGDLNQTAAIVKEIIFSHKKLNRTNKHITVDLGSGSGILLLAGMLAGTRNKIQNTIGLGIESSTPAVKKSKKIFHEKIFPGKSNRYSILNKNITQPDAHFIYSRDVDCLLSETISHSTPPLTFLDSGDLTMTKHAEIDEMSAHFGLQAQIHNEPYFAGLIMASHFDPDFIKKVRMGIIDLFPNIIDESYIPTGRRGLIKLETGLDPEKHLDLREIGEEFNQISTGLPGVLQTRW